MKIILAKNVKKNIDNSVYELFCLYAQKCGLDVDVVEDLSKLEDTLKNDNIDCVAVFGGDGTMLVYAHVCTKYNVPILAINRGNIGFLSELEVKDLLKGLSLLAEGKYTIEHRSMLKIKYRDLFINALNEVLFCNKIRSGTIALDVYLQQELVDTYVGDGIILATPTGSTAYSLSAGGPLIYPDLKVILLTPLNTHSLRHRPIIFDGSSNLKVISNSLEDCFVDGVLMDWKIDANSPVYVSQSNQQAKFIRFTTANFFSKVFSKLCIASSIHAEQN